MSDVVAGGDGAVEQAAPLGAIRINIKRSDHAVDVDMDKLTWKDAKELRKYRAAIAGGTMDEEQLIGVMEGILEKVTGQKIDDMPASVVNRVAEILFQGDTAAAEAEKN